MKKAVVHFEIGCSDLPETAAFYEKTFGWQVAQQGHLASIDTGREGAIPGHLNRLTPDEPQQYITIYIETDTIDDDLQAVEANGGKVLVPPTTLPDGRQFAWFKDVAGNTVGIITPK